MKYSEVDVLRLEYEVTPNTREYKLTSRIAEQYKDVNLTRA